MHWGSTRFRAGLHPATVVRLSVHPAAGGRVGQWIQLRFQLICVIQLHTSTSCNTGPCMLIQGPWIALLSKTKGTPECHR
jgi:hypothetical protein